MRVAVAYVKVDSVYDPSPWMNVDYTLCYIIRRLLTGDLKLQYVDTRCITSIAAVSGEMSMSSLFGGGAACEGKA